MPKVKYELDQASQDFVLDLAISAVRNEHQPVLRSESYLG